MDKQNVHVEAQLDAGIRFLQAQTHLDRRGQLSLCHTNCGMKHAGTVHDFLSTIVDWLVRHPNEVVTLLTDDDKVSLDYFKRAFNSSGVEEIAYLPLPSHNRDDISTWPTLHHIISNERRLIAYLDSYTESFYPLIRNEWDEYWETKLDSTNANFPDCATSRPRALAKDPGDARYLMYIMNHFLDTKLLGVVIPDRYDAKRTNAATGKGSIGAQAELCREAYGKFPNVVLVDYFDRGSVFEAQKILNGLS